LSALSSPEKNRHQPAIAVIGSFDPIVTQTMLESVTSLAYGFNIALQPQNLFYCFIGVTMGTLVGVLPGIGPTATIALLLPATFKLDPIAAIIMLSGICYGAMYGGSTTSILLNIPGEASSVVTCLDGYQMARKGRPGPALGISAFGSFIAGTVRSSVLFFSHRRSPTSLSDSGRRNTSL
jgi:putative tricarboxylic transport membrane protein